MTLLLDTHLLLWAAGEPEKLSKEARSLLLSKHQKLWFSSASLWEIAIKQALGRNDFLVDPGALLAGLLEHGYQELNVKGSHAVAIANLPPIHRDPFDRLLVAQAMVEGLMLVTTDKVIAQYPGQILYV